MTDPALFDDSSLLKALTSSLTLSSTLEHLYNALRDFLPLSGIFSNILLPDPNRILFLASADSSGGQTMHKAIPLPDSVMALRSQNSASIVLANTIEEDPFTTWVAPQCFPNIKSFLMVRCTLEGQHFGIVCFWSDKENAFSSEDRAKLLSIINALSLNVGFAVTSRLRDEMLAVQQEAQRLRARLNDRVWGPLNELLERTPSFKRIAEDIRRVAPYDATVLITGASGTGKEVVATVIQQTGPRAQRPFVKVNCAAIPPNLIESELFGFEKGAFTGATTRHAGLFEQADGGTLFLDEIGELSAEMQVKLLPVLQQQTFRRVGGTHEISVNVRIIAATNQPLRDLVAAGTFRLDLLYRLAVVPIHLPPLSERQEDLAPLGRYFLELLSRKYGISPVPTLSPEALAAAQKHHWLGNVREWRNVLARAVLSGQNPIRELDFALNGLATPTLSGVPSMLSSTQEISWSPNTPDARRESHPENTLAATQSFEEMQRTYFRELLKKTNGRISGPQGAAALAQMHPNTLRSRLEKLGL